MIQLGNHAREFVPNESLEQRHVHAVVLGQLVDGGVGAQLAVVADEHQVLHGGREAGERVRLEHLGRLLHERDGRLDRLEQRLVLRRARCRHAHDAVVREQRLVDQLVGRLLALLHVQVAPLGVAQPRAHLRRAPIGPAAVQRVARGQRQREHVVDLCGLRVGHRTRLTACLRRSSRTHRRRNARDALQVAAMSAAVHRLEERVVVAVRVGRDTAVVVCQL